MWKDAFPCKCKKVYLINTPWLLSSIGMCMVSEFYTHIHMHMDGKSGLSPPDPINNLRSLPDRQISGNSLTDRSVQIQKTSAEDQMLQDPNLCTRLCSTAFNTQPGWRFHFRPTKMIVRKCFVPLWYHLPKGALKGTLTGMALTYFYYTICSVWRIVDLSVS